MASRTGGEGLAGDQRGGAADFLRRGRGDAARSQFRLQDPLTSWFHRPAFLFTRILDPPGDVVIGHLQLGQQDGAVLSASGGDGYNQDKNKKGLRCT